MNFIVSLCKALTPQENVCFFKDCLFPGFKSWPNLCSSNFTSYPENSVKSRITVPSFERVSPKVVRRQFI